MPNRVAITGLGVVSNIGLNANDFWNSLVLGRSGIGPITTFEQNDDWKTRIAGEIDWDPVEVFGQAEAKKLDRFCAMGLQAASEAAECSGIDFNKGNFDRRGVVIGSGIGGISTIEYGAVYLRENGPKRIRPYFVPRLMANASTGSISIKYNLKGFNTTPATACASGGHAMAEAHRVIRDGEADLMFAGGAEAAISPVTIASFQAMKALSTRNEDPKSASRPFDKDRDGFVLSEGAAVVIMESWEHAIDRGATIYAECLGGGITGDAHHIAAPDPVGAGAGAAMKLALEKAQINTTQVGYINAHGTSTPLGDASEVQAVRNLFKEHSYKLGISSTKSMTGHALGAAGGLESVATILALFHGVLPPTINLDNPDDDFDLNFIPHEPQEKQVSIGMNNTFGFGGHNVSLVFGHVR